MQIPYTSEYTLLNFRIQAGDTKLKHHFENAQKTATYRSKTIQNKLVKICGKQIQDKVISEINSSDSPFYSVLADEATECGNKEQMAIILLYIDSQKQINECFIKFVSCEDGVTGLALAKNIEYTLEEVGIPLANCRGQGYDGASAMSSMRKGVWTDIEQESKSSIRSLLQSSFKPLCCQSM